MTAMQNPFLELQNKLNEIRQQLKSIELPKQPDYISISQASELLNLSKSAIYKRTMSNQLPFYKVGRKLMFKRSELLEFINNNKNI